MLSIVAGRSQTVLNLNFDSGDLSAFNQYYGATPTAGASVTQTAGIGTGGSGGVGFLASPASTDVTAIYNASSFNLTTGIIYSFSADYHKKSATGVYAQFQLGFFADNSVSTSSSNRYITFRVVGQGVTGSANTYQLQLNNRDNSTTDVNLGSTFTMSDTNTDWYQLSGTLTLIDATSKTFSYTISLLDLGSDGTASATVVQSLSGTFVNSYMATDTSWWLGLRDQTSSLTAVDNLSAVPEPRAAMLLGAAGILLGLVRRRAKRA